MVQSCVSFELKYSLHNIAQQYDLYKNSTTSNANNFFELGLDSIQNCSQN